MQRHETESLGTFLSYVMAQNDVSAGKLAQAAGVAENSIRNMLRFGLEDDAPAPSPKLLVAVADFLRLDPTWLFSLAGYLPTTRREIGVMGEYVAARFEELTLDQQNGLLDTLEDFEKANGLPHYRQEIRKWQKQAHELRGNRSLWFIKPDQLLTRLLGGISEEAMLRSIEFHLGLLLPNTPPTSDDILHVTQHPVGKAILGEILPEKDVPTGLSRLYYLSHFNEDRAIKLEVKGTILATWQLLVDATELPNRREAQS
ncbi:MAG: hypothetical protein ABI947_19220 [Chloroflexota bacterium]